MKYLLCIVLFACSSLPEPATPAQVKALELAEKLAQEPRFQKLSVDCVKFLVQNDAESCYQLAKQTAFDVPVIEEAVRQQLLDFLHYLEAQKLVK